jgi:lysophospholipase L1-like esterase
VGGSSGSGANAGAGGTSSEPPLHGLEVSLHLNLGDSVGAGYNAQGLNGESGRAYARLIYDNHPSTPAYADHNLLAHSPGAVFVDRAKSGGQSQGVLGQTNSLPPSSQDTLVTIYVGGNDFNDEVGTMIDPGQTQAAIQNWETNMGTVLDRLRAAYDDPATGRELVVTLATIHEPTDATLSIPPQYTDGFCEKLQQLSMLGDELKQTVWTNYQTFNAAIRTFAQARGAVLVDTEAYFVGHGLNAPAAEQWLDDDCAHFTDIGHHELRREVWRLLTGETY